ncbi:MAG: hypothetical protein ACK4K7_06680 [Allosphingosinicella sp.]|uniref:hypothetical protein n=1 Tax=Allosphingosinicella sp. TaxID=2823234 RepID=UPI003938087F
MVTKAEERPDVAGAADRLLKACAGAACRFILPPPAGAAGIARIYQDAAAAERTEKRK